MRPDASAVSGGRVVGERVDEPELQVAVWLCSGGPHVRRDGDEQPTAHVWLIASRGGRPGVGRRSVLVRLPSPDGCLSPRLFVAVSVYLAYRSMDPPPNIWSSAILAA